jgi:hypothetical protein
MLTYIWFLPRRRGDVDWIRLALANTGMSIKVCMRVSIVWLAEGQLCFQLRLSCVQSVVVMCRTLREPNTKHRLSYFSASSRPNWIPPNYLLISLDSYIVLRYKFGKAFATRVQHKVLMRNKTNSVAFIPQANYTDWSIAAAGEVVSTFSGRGCCVFLRPVNLSSLDWSRYFSFK